MEDEYVASSTRSKRMKPDIRKITEEDSINDILVKFLSPVAQVELTYDEQKNEGINIIGKNTYNLRIPEFCKEVDKLGDRIFSVNLRENNITSAGVPMLMECLCKLNKLTYLNLYGNKIDDKGIKDIGEFIKKNKVLNYLDIRMNKIGDKGIKELTPYLIESKSLQHLDISRNEKITAESLPELISIIEKSNIDNLDVQLLPEKKSLELLLHCIKKKLKGGKLVALDFYYRTLTDDIVTSLCEIIKDYQNDNLQVINLITCNLSKASTTQICKALTKYKSLTSVSIHAAEVDDESIKYLCELVQENPGLTSLSFQNCKLTDKHIDELAPYLFGSLTLQSLSLHSNPAITEASLPNLRDLIWKTSLKQLNLWASSLSQDSIYSLQTSLTTPLEEREIPINSNTKSAAKISE